MKEYVMIPFQVHEDKVEEAKAAIEKLISNVREKEPGTLLYHSLQLQKDPSSFIHFIIFSDNEAHMSHRQAGYVLEFVKTLYALCPNEPYPIFLENFDACGVAAEALDRQ